VPRPKPRSGPTESLVEFASTLRRSNAVPVMELPHNRAAREDFTLYLALCVVGRMKWSLTGYATRRLPEFGIELTPKGLDLWKTKDEACAALWRHWREGKPATTIATQWIKKAKAVK